MELRSEMGIAIAFDPDAIRGGKIVLRLDQMQWRYPFHFLIPSTVFLV